MQAISNNKIIGGFNRREPGAVSWIYESYQPVVYTIARRLIGHSPEIHDLVAEVFARLIEQTTRFSNLSGIKSFLYLITRNTCLNYLQRRQVIEEAHKGIPLVDDDHLTTSESMAHFQVLVNQAIERLPKKTKEVFQLFYSEQRTNSEIAKQLHRTEKTVANQKALAIKILKLELQGKKNFIFLLNIFL